MSQDFTEACTTTIHAEMDPDISLKVPNVVTSMSEPMISNDDDTVSVLDIKSKYFYCIAWICFFILGTFNNYINVVVVSSSKNLADSFDDTRFIGSITWALSLTSFIAKGINGLYLEKVSHKRRTIFTVFINLIGIIGLTFSKYINFYFALGCLLLLGGGTSFGENVIVGFLKIFPSKLSGAWSYYTMYIHVY